MFCGFVYGKEYTLCLWCFEKNGDYLLVKSKDSRKWNLPGGRKLKSETYEESLKREAFEELGGNFFVSDHIYSKSFDTSKGKTKDKRFFTIEPLFDQDYSPNSEIKKVKYFSYEDIKGLKSKGKLKKGVFKAIKNVKKNKLEKSLV